MNTSYRNTASISLPAHQWEDQLRECAPFGRFGWGENQQNHPATALSST